MHLQVCVVSVIYCLHVLKTTKCASRVLQYFFYFILFFFLSLRFALRSHYVTSVTAATSTSTAHQLLLRCCRGLQISNILLIIDTRKKKVYTIYIYVYIYIYI